MRLSAEQKLWLVGHPDYEPVGPPTADVAFSGCGTLYGDGSFEPMAPMKVVKLLPGCVCVGKRKPDGR